MKTVGAIIRSLGLILFGSSALFSAIYDLAIVGCNFGSAAVILSILVMPLTALAVPIYAVMNGDYFPMMLLGVMLVSVGVYVLGEKMG